MSSGVVLTLLLCLAAHTTAEAPATDVLPQKRSFKSADWPPRSKFITFTPHHVDTLASWQTRGLNSEEDGPFWANRGRSLDEDEQEVFWAGRGRALPEDIDVTLLFSDRSAEQDDPFWAHRGRAADIEGDTHRSLNSGEEDPFWANRGRRQDPTDDPDTDEGWRKHRLYVDEPGWVWINRREAQLPYDVTFSSNPASSDPFWVARGKRSHSQQKRDLSCFTSRNPDKCWNFTGKRLSHDYLRELSRPDEFWPMRGKRPVWPPSRERRTDQLSRALEIAKDDHFWPTRGKKSNDQKQKLLQQ